jgi:hypothetical protein
LPKGCGKILRVNTPKTLGIAAASTILPGVVLIGTLLGTVSGNNGQNTGNPSGTTSSGDPGVNYVPEVNPGIVLVPFVGAVLLVSSLQLWRLRAQKNGSLS